MGSSYASHCCSTSRSSSEELSSVVRGEGGGVERGGDCGALKGGAGELSIRIGRVPDLSLSVSIEGAFIRGGFCFGAFEAHCLSSSFPARVTAHQPLRCWTNKGCKATRVFNALTKCLFCTPYFWISLRNTTPKRVTYRHGAEARSS